MADFEVKAETELAENPEVQAKNGLLYVMPQSLSSTVDKTFIRQQAQRQTYLPGQTMVFDMNTGSRYIDPDNCFLYLDVFTDSPTDKTLDTNYTPLREQVGALALIEEIHIHAKSGIELDRIQEVNQYAYTRALLRDGRDHYNDWARIWGGGEWVATHAPINGQIGSTTRTRVCLPMKLLSGLFDPVVKGMKMPPGLLSGARIEITLESFARAFSSDVGASAATTYTVENPIIICMSHELNDNSQSVLNETSVENGLEYTYCRAFTAVQPSNSNNVNIQIKKAVSQGLRAFAVPIKSTSYENRAEDAFWSDLSFNNYQYRVGSNFFPQQRIDSAIEGYLTTTSIYNKGRVSDWNPPALNFDEYAGAAPNYIQGAGFETDSAINLSGIPINNSATCTIESTVNAGGNEYRWMVFLEYVAVARSYLTNVEVKI